MKCWLFPSLAMLVTFPCLAGNDGGRIEVVGPDTIDFGKYPAMERKAARYTIRNSGDGLLRIVQVRKTCGCASATCDKQELKPKEEAVVEVVVLPNSIFGLFSKNTFVESTDPNNRFLRLTVAGNAIPLVEIKPQASVYAGRIPTNKPWMQSFELKATRAGVRLGELKTESNYPVEVATNVLGDGPECRYQLDVKLLPTAESGDLRCIVSIPVLEPTNHPPVKVSVSGTIGAELCAVPGIFNLPVSDRPIARTFALRVLGQRTRVLDPASLKLPKQEGVSFKMEQDKDGHALLVTATFAPEFTKQLYADEKIPLVFEVPGASCATVVCKAKN